MRDVAAGRLRSPAVGSGAPPMARSWPSHGVLASEVELGLQVAVAITWPHEPEQARRHARPAVTVISIGDGHQDASEQAARGARVGPARQGDPAPMPGAVADDGPRRDPLAHGRARGSEDAPKAKREADRGRRVPATAQQSTRHHLHDRAAAAAEIAPDRHRARLTGPTWGRRAKIHAIPKPVTVDLERPPGWPAGGAAGHAARGPDRLDRWRSREPVLDLDVDSYDAFLASLHSIEARREGTGVAKQGAPPATHTGRPRRCLPSAARRLHHGA